MSTTGTAAADTPSTSGTEVAVGPPADNDLGAGGEISWVRAILSGLAVLVVGFGAGLVGANAILTKALGLTRDARQWLATALFLVVVIALAWALRWLQGRGLI